MRIKQLSIFIENRSGRLAKITRILGEAQINIRAMSLADTSDFGILRLVVNDTQKARDVLKEKGFTVGVTDVIAVEIPDRPGSLGDLLTILEKAGLNVEYMYAFLQKNMDNAVMMLRVEEFDKAIEQFVANGVTVLESQKIYNM